MLNLLFQTNRNIPRILETIPRLYYDSKLAYNNNFYFTVLSVYMILINISIFCLSSIYIKSWTQFPLLLSFQILQQHPLCAHPQFTDVHHINADYRLSSYLEHFRV